MPRASVRPRLAILCGKSDLPHDAILAYARRLASAMRSGHEIDVTILKMAGRGRWLQDGDPAQGPGRPTGFDAYLLQYNPFAFGSRGFAPWLAPSWRALGRGRVPLVLTVHEAFVPFAGGVRQVAMGAWQRAQLTMLAAMSDAALACSRERAQQVRAYSRRLEIRELPVGSNLPDVVEAAARTRLRDHLAGPQRRPIVATFGNAHPSRSMGHIERAASQLADRLGSFVLLNLGVTPPVISAPTPQVEVVVPGGLSAPDLSTYLSCADLLMLPYASGAITGKGTLMAALALGCPVLSTVGSATDDVLLDPGLRLVAIGDQAGFATTAVALMGDPTERARLGRRGRSLYEREFAWNVIADRTLVTIGMAPGRCQPGRAGQVLGKAQRACPIGRVEPRSDACL